MKRIEVTEQFVKDAYAASKALNDMQGTGDISHFNHEEAAKNLDMHFIRDTPDGVIHVAGSAYVIEDYP